MMERLVKFLRGPDLSTIPKNLGTQIGWSESQLYTKDIPKYNPDELIGAKGWGIYRKMMIDEQVKAVVKFKRDAITSRDYFFEYDDTSELSDTEKDLRIEIYDTMLRKVKGSFTDGLNFVMTAMYQGFSMTEKVFDIFEYKGTPYIGVSKLMPKPYDTFEFIVDQFGNIEKVSQTIDNSEQKIDLDKFVYYIHNPEFDQHYGQSDLREAYRSWYSKDISIRLSNQFLERLAGGLIIAKPKEGASLRVGSEDYNAVLAAITNISAATSMLLPSNIEVEVITPQSTDQFEKHLVLHDLQIAKALLVPNLLGVTHAGQTGSFAQSQTQLEAFLWTLDADALRLADAMNEQVFDVLSAMNFADGMGPTFKFKPVSEEMKHKIVATWKDLVQAGAVEATDTDEEHLRRLMEFPEKGEPIKKEVAPIIPGVPPEKKKPEVPAKKPDDKDPEEKFSIISAEAFTRATQRVSFVVIDKKSTDLETRHVVLIEAQIANMLAGLMVKVEDRLLGSRTGGTTEIRKLDFERRDKTKTRRAIDAMLKDAWKLGSRHANDEIASARKETTKFDFVRLEDNAAQFLNVNGFRMLGDFSESMLSIVRRLLMNGIKYSWTNIETVNKVYDSLTLGGFITMETNLAATGRTLGALEETLQQAINNAHRIKTSTRTNAFEAINEARYNIFTDPDLDGFVEALEYSAILDSRTTDICVHLDGRVYPTDSNHWNSIRPPNHFNCRSILVPVTVVDDDIIGKDHETGSRYSKEPSKEPQRGFGSEVG